MGLAILSAQGSAEGSGRTAGSLPMLFGDRGGDPLQPSRLGAEKGLQRRDIAVVYLMMFGIPFQLYRLL
jgi:hypothetical protein